MNDRQPDAGTDGMAADRIVGLAFGNYVVTAPETRAAAPDAGLSPQARDALRVNLNQIAEHDALAAEPEQRFADYWGGTGPGYEAEAQAGQDGEPWPEAPWWDGEKLHGAEPAARETQAAAEPEAGL